MSKTSVQNMDDCSLSSNNKPSKFCRSFAVYFAFVTVCLAVIVICFIGGIFHQEIFETLGGSAPTGYLQKLPNFTNASKIVITSDKESSSQFGDGLTDMGRMRVKFEQNLDKLEAKLNEKLRNETDHLVTKFESILLNIHFLNASLTQRRGQFQQLVEKVKSLESTFETNNITVDKSDNSS